MNGQAHLEAEMAVLGCVFVRNEVLAQIHLDERAFSSPRHRHVFAAMRRLEQSGVAIDELTLGAELERAGHLDAIGGMAFLSSLSLRVPTADNLAHYVEMVREYALTRTLVGTLAELQDKARAGLSGSELLDATLAAITAIDVGKPTQSLRIGEVVKERLRELGEIADARARGEFVTTGVPTGIGSLDEKIGGCPFGLVTVICGRPAMGKSAFALGLADAASTRGYGVHVFSLEDPRASYADRALSRESRITVTQLRAATFARDDMQRLGNAARTLIARDHWLYEDISTVGAEELVRIVRRERAANRTRLVIVDYLQLLQRPRRFENTHDAISQNMNTLASAAKQDQIAYVVLSQLSRTLERREDKRPQLADLRESGSIEERAKLILGLYRGSYYGDPKPGIDYDEDEQPPSTEEWESRVDLLLLKDMNGETGYVRRRFHGPTTRIY